MKVQILEGKFAQNLAKSESWQEVKKNYFRLAQNFFGNFSPGFPDPKILVPHGCYNMMTRTERKKCTNLQKFLVQRCGVKLYGLESHYGWYFAEFKFFLKKFNLKKYIILLSSIKQFSFNWFPGFARIWDGWGGFFQVFVNLCAQV